jgi:hypothetical protein
MEMTLGNRRLVGAHTGAVDRGPKRRGPMGRSLGMGQSSSRSSQSAAGSSRRVPGTRTALTVRLVLPFGGRRPVPGGCEQRRNVTSRPSDDAIRASISSRTPSASPFSIIDHIDWLTPATLLRCVWVSRADSRAFRRSAPKWRITSSISGGWSRKSYGIDPFQSMTLIAYVPAAYPILTMPPAIAQGDDYDPKEIDEGVWPGACERDPRLRARAAGRRPARRRAATIGPGPLRPVCATPSGVEFAVTSSTLRGEPIA